MKPPTSKKKRKASEGMCTNPPAPLLGPLAVDMDKQAPPLKKKRLNKRDAATIPSSGSLPIDKDRQQSPRSLPVDKDKQPFLFPREMLQLYHHPDLCPLTRIGSHHLDLCLLTRISSLHLDLCPLTIISSHHLDLCSLTRISIHHYPKK
ncbi:uncharacterized protein LOC119316980 isoform X2 [Triticum dicoccoides]|uniref:uncharacterized protein LOC119316980 isoform X2 n=1 Tax=Triticum dicoccoides TaxID=85692 RepID=UPI001890FD39|nr:uncharacterized protein LOC119316980 isoform X2 [Triticum dicoccoides]